MSYNFYISNFIKRTSFLFSNTFYASISEKQEYEKKKEKEKKKRLEY